jgi:hypothetical protein
MLLLFGTKDFCCKMHAVVYMMDLHIASAGLCCLHLDGYGAIVQLTLMVSLCMQAIFHGKPVVAMPYFGDQPSNADKMVAKVIPSHPLQWGMQSLCCMSGLRMIVWLANSSCHRREHKCGPT